MVAKEPKARRKAGLIATHPTAMVVINLAVEATEKKERNIHHVDQHPAHVKRRVRENHGVKKQKKERKNEINRIKTKTINQRRADE